MTAYVAHVLSATPVVGIDHAVHLFKGWQFTTQHLPTGRLRGFSHEWQLGYPTGDLVPLGEEAWIALFRGLTLGQLSWFATYRVAIAALQLLQGVAVFSLSRRYFGRAGATIAALATMLDPGAVFEGGWAWHTYMGVWPITLGLSLVALSLAKLEDTLRSGSRWNLVVAALCVGAALASHQISLVVLALAMPCLLFDYWTRKGRGSWVPFSRVLVATLLGLSLAAFFVVPLVFRGHLTVDRGQPGSTFVELGQRLVEFRLYTATWSPITLFGFVGIITGLCRRKPGSLFLVTAWALCLLVASNLFFGIVAIERAVPSLVKLELGRMIQVSKLFWFPLAADGLWEVYGAIKARSRVPENLRQIIAILVPLALFAPLTTPVAKTLFATQVQKNYPSAFPNLLLQNYLQLNEWAALEKTKNPDFYRIAYSADTLHSLAALSPMLSHTAVFKARVSTPSHFFANAPFDEDPKLYETALVKYVVADHPLSGPDYTLLRTFGTLSVYQFNRYRKEPFTVEGGGTGELLTFEPELVEVNIRDSRPGTRLKLHVANYERWEARQQGRVLPISTAPAYDHEHPYLMSVQAKDGIVRFRYVYRFADWLGLSLTWLAVVILGAIAWTPRKLRARWEPIFHSPRLIRLVLGSCLLGILVLLTILSLRLGTRQHLLRPASLFHRIGGSDLSLNGTPCKRLGILEYHCGNASLSAEYVPGRWGAHLCLAAPDGKSLTLHKSMPLQRGLLISYEALTATGTIEVLLDGKSLGVVPVVLSADDFRNVYFDTSSALGRASDLQVKITGDALRCFDIKTVP